MRRQLTEPVYFTIEQVYKATRHVGLRRLCVGMRHDLQGLESTRHYIDQVLRYCPNLERFDGFRAAVFAMNQRIAYEQWSMDLDLWTQFCATLGHLVEFDWISVPFATRFFEIFGQHPKPKMKSMTFTAAMNWRWDRYLSDIGPEQKDQLTKTGYAGTAKHAHAVLSACPNLKVLGVYWYNQPPAPAQMNLMDPEIFGDEFWEAAVRLCPQLTRASLVGVSKVSATKTVRSFTDRSLRALATLPRLEFMECESVNVTGEGIFDLAVHHASSYSGRTRRFHVLLGTAQTEATDLSFYTAVTVFLEKLLMADAPLPCMEHVVTVAIENRRRVPVETEWSEQYLVNLKQLMQQVKEKHSGVLLYAFANDCDGTRFSQLSELVFDTHDKSELWVEHDDTPVGDSLWNRVPLSDSDDDDDDEDFYDDSDGSDGGEYYDDYDDYGEYDDYDPYNDFYDDDAGGSDDDAMDDYMW